MSDLYYSSGQAAKELSVSQDRVRALCEAGAIVAKSTTGGQWRIPQDELRRLKREGLPPLPRPLPNAEPVIIGKRLTVGAGHRALLAGPSEEVIRSNESLALLENEIKALGLERQMEEQLDYFRQRSREEADRRAAQNLAEQRRKAQAKAERERQQWLERWENYAIVALPWDAPAEGRLEVHERIRRQLGELCPLPTDSVTRQIVNGVVEPIGRKWRQKKGITDILIDVRDHWLPWEARGTSSQLSNWQIRALQAAAKAMEAQPKDSSIAIFRTVARQAVQPILAEIEHLGNCDRIVNGVTLCLQRETNLERQAAKNAAAKALASAPIGASWQQLEKIRDAALAPIKTAIAERESRERQQKIEADLKWKEERRRTSIETRLDYRLNHILDYLRKLEIDEIEFANFADRWDLYQKLKKRIGPILIEELLGGGGQTDVQIHQQIEALVDAVIGEFLEPD